MNTGAITSIPHVGFLPQVPGTFYLWISLPILLLTFLFNTWAVVVILKKEQNGMKAVTVDWSRDMILVEKKPAVKLDGGGDLVILDECIRPLIDA